MTKLVKQWYIFKQLVNHQIITLLKKKKSKQNTPKKLHHAQKLTDLTEIIYFRKIQENYTAKHKGSKLWH